MGGLEENQKERKQSSDSEEEFSEVAAEELENNEILSSLEQNIIFA